MQSEKQCVQFLNFISFLLITVTFHSETKNIFAWKLFESLNFLLITYLVLHICPYFLLDFSYDGRNVRESQENFNFTLPSNSIYHLID